MKLHDTLINNECIGKGTSAQISEGKAWVTYSDGNDGEKGYFRDVLIGGHCAYMHGEFCEIRGYDETKLTVTMYSQNGEDSAEDWDGVFIIPYEQYLADFGTRWHIPLDKNMKTKKYFVLEFAIANSDCTSSMCVLGYRKPTLEEAKNFWKADCELYGDESLVDIYEISQEEAYESYNMENESSFPIFE